MGENTDKMQSRSTRDRGYAFGFRHLAILAVSLANEFGVSAYSSTGNKRWTENSSPYNYKTDETYVDVKGFTESFRMQWEMYEGSIALTQMAVVWKEISTKSDATYGVQIKRSKTGFTSEVMRVRRIWQLESKGASLNIFDDEQGQSTNDFANMEYINKVPQDPAEWFVGDVIPFENCAYIVNMNYDSNADRKVYRFSRLTTAVRWDPVFKRKKVVTQESHMSDAYTRSLGNNNDYDNLDFPKK